MKITFVRLILMSHKVYHMNYANHVNYLDINFLLRITMATVTLAPSLLEEMFQSLNKIILCMPILIVTIVSNLAL